MPEPLPLPQPVVDEDVGREPVVEDEEEDDKPTMASLPTTPPALPGEFRQPLPLPRASSLSEALLLIDEAAAL